MPLRPIEKKKSEVTSSSKSINTLKRGEIFRKQKEKVQESQKGTGDKTSSMENEAIQAVPIKLKETSSIQELEEVGPVVAVEEDSKDAYNSMQTSEVSAERRVRLIKKS